MIAFVRRKGHEIDGLYLVEPDGSNLRRVETGALWLLEPSWSPDGAAIVGVGRTKTWDDPADFIGQLNVMSLEQSAAHWAAIWALHAMRASTEARSSHATSV